MLKESTSSAAGFSSHADLYGTPQLAELCLLRMLAFTRQLITSSFFLYFLCRMKDETGAE